jgi:glutathione S-transferase
VHGVKLYRARFSTNVERVLLALAHKGLTAEDVWIEYTDRSPVEQVSGQGLVPVLVDDDGTVVHDSPRILAYLERRHPDPPLYPADPRRAELELFIDWFNHVWKVWPNAIAAGEGDAQEHAEHMETALDHFERLLQEREYLFGDEFSAADCIAYPFLKYAAGRDPRDDEAFHVILEERQSVDGRPALAAWINRVSARVPPGA